MVTLCYIHIIILCIVGGSIYGGVVFWFVKLILFNVCLICTHNLQLTYLVKRSILSGLAKMAGVIYI